LEARKGVKWNPFFTHIHFWYDHGSYALEYAQSVAGKDVPIYGSTVVLEEDANSPNQHKHWKNVTLAVGAGIMGHVGSKVETLRKNVYNELQDIWTCNIEVLMEKQVVRPGLYSLMDVANDKNERENVSS
jgi:hypothetical protein